MNNKASRKRGAFLFKPQRHEEHEDASLFTKLIQWISIKIFFISL